METADHALMQTGFLDGFVPQAYRQITQQSLPKLQSQVSVRDFAGQIPIKDASEACEAGGEKDHG
jgi:hypothetical protein